MLPLWLKDLICQSRKEKSGPIRNLAHPKEVRLGLRPGLSASANPAKEIIGLSRLAVTLSRGVPLSGDSGSLL